MEQIDTKNCAVKLISLVAEEKSLRERLSNDVERGIRTADIMERSVARIPLYQALDTMKIDTSEKTVAMVVNEIKKL